MPDSLNKVFLFIDVSTIASGWPAARSSFRLLPAQLLVRGRSMCVCLTCPGLSRVRNGKKGSQVGRRQMGGVHVDLAMHGACSFSRLRASALSTWPCGVVPHDLSELQVAESMLGAQVISPMDHGSGRDVGRHGGLEERGGLCVAVVGGGRWRFLGSALWRKAHVSCRRPSALRQRSAPYRFRALAPRRGAPSVGRLGSARSPSPPPIGRRQAQLRFLSNPDGEPEERRPKPMTAGERPPPRGPRARARAQTAARTR